MLYLAACIIFVIGFIVKLVGHSGTWDWAAFTVLGLAVLALGMFVHGVAGWRSHL